MASVRERYVGAFRSEWRVQSDAAREAEIFSSFQASRWDPDS
jgi:hypothetical protein